MNEKEWKEKVIFIALCGSLLPLKEINKEEIKQRKNTLLKMKANEKIAILKGGVQRFNLYSCFLLQIFENSIDNQLFHLLFTKYCEPGFFGKMINEFIIDKIWSNKINEEMLINYTKALGNNREACKSFLQEIHNALKSFIFLHINCKNAKLKKCVLKVFFLYPYIFFCFDDIYFFRYYIMHFVMIYQNIFLILILFQQY